MALQAIRGFFDFLAKMGLSIRDDPPRVIQLEGRAWGPDACGFALSIQREPGIVSVILRNTSDAARQISAPDFARWFRFDVKEPDGSAAVLTAFGQRLLKPDRATAVKLLHIAARGAIEAQIPIDSVFALHSNTNYSVTASCAVDDWTVTSNTILLHK